MMPPLPYESPPPRYRRLDGISTADSPSPELSFRDGNILLEYADWREQRIRFHFHDVVAFRWQDEMPLPDGVRDDSAYEVDASPLIAELAARGALAKGATYRHLMFCFHPIGAVLEVVALEMTAE
jgi:hypothetical protein